jgi:DNA-binding response OmpR family regulator
MKGTILLVEDSPTFRKTYKNILEGSGFKVLESEDGEKAWALVQSQKPSLVLLDLLLPKMSGLEVLKNIRATEASREIPVIIFSLLGEKVDIQKGLDAGANDYTVKGFYSPREVVRKIEAVLTSTARVRNLTIYQIFPAEGQEDAAKLQQEVGLTRGFLCPACGVGMILQLIPDYSRTDGHWFAAHLVCPGCKRGF